MTTPEPRIKHYLRWLRDTRGLEFHVDDAAGYDALWRWSTENLSAFWGSIWDYFEIESPSRFDGVLVEEKMPGAQWFRGAQVNYVRQLMRHADATHAAGHPA